jgi:hypothetical protein
MKIKDPVIKQLSKAEALEMQRKQFDDQHKALSQDQAVDGSKNNLTDPDNTRN